MRGDVIEAGGRSGAVQLGAQRVLGQPAPVVGEQELGWPPGAGVLDRAAAGAGRAAIRSTSTRVDVEQADGVVGEDVLGVASARCSVVLPADAVDPQPGQFIAAQPGEQPALGEARTRVLDHLNMSLWQRLPHDSAPLTAGHGSDKEDRNETAVLLVETVEV
jgi:hypothetical protein